MTDWTQTTLTTWGRSRFARSDVSAPGDEASLRDAVLRAHPRGVISYGGGRCYGDASLDDGGQTVLTRNLNRILSFDPSTCEVVCKSGVKLSGVAGAVSAGGFLFSRFGGDGQRYGWWRVCQRYPLEEPPCGGQLRAPCVVDRSDAGER